MCRCACYLIGSTALCLLLGYLLSNCYKASAGVRLCEVLGRVLFVRFLGYSIRHVFELLRGEAFLWIVSLFLAIRHGSCQRFNICVVRPFLEAMRKLGYIRSKARHETTEGSYSAYYGTFSTLMSICTYQQLSGQGHTGFDTYTNVYVVIYVGQSQLQHLLFVNHDMLTVVDVSDLSLSAQLV